MANKKDPSRRDFLKFLGALGTVALTGGLSKALAETISADVKNYKFNTVEKEFLERYFYITVEAFGRTDRYVVDMQSKNFGGQWEIVPGTNKDLSHYKKAIESSHGNSKQKFALFIEAAAHHTQMRMSELIKKCPIPTKAIEVEEGNPKGYAMIAVTREKYEDGKFFGGLENWTYQPVKAKADGDFDVINVFQRKKNAHGEWENIYIKDSNGKYIINDKGERLQPFTQEYLAYSDARMSVGSRRTYNRFYLNSPPQNNLVVRDSVGAVFLYEPMPDGKLTIPKKWFNERETVCRETDYQMQLSLENFAAAEKKRSNVYVFWHVKKDANGKVISSEAITVEPQKHPEMQKAIKRILHQSTGPQSSIEGKTKIASADSAQISQQQGKNTGRHRA